ncbi:MarR family transcriptional regulator [Nocardioides sp. AE5]|uniref:MarR family winged helix-turn-helix transcriptional regulator n=1 Tax=Nocardioides sp. AE5 TaxID=2962573 RepID=UPI0028817959|nr:MarR family transcriptional regulator [Nocardioides sp. AE5]MDT0203033.1 MarR family transcriptional regulator [Nocardioides sp. AE5]
MPGDRPARTSADELLAFEDATRDLVGIALRSVADLELSLPQFRLLLVLHEQGPSPSTQVARALGVVGSTVTRLADRLDASGHLSRGTDPGNRSVVTLALTEEGRSLVRQVTNQRRRDLRRALDQLSPAERAACAAALVSLHGVLDTTAYDDPGNPLPL